MHVQVRNLQPGDDHARALGVERLAHRFADQLGDLHDSAEGSGVHVLPLIDLLARDDERVPMRHGLDRQERHDVVVLVDEPAWQIPVDDLGEDGSHTREHSSKLSVAWQWGGSLLGDGCRYDGPGGITCAPDYVLDIVIPRPQRGTRASRLCPPPA